MLQNLSCMSAHGSEHGPHSQHTCVCTFNLGADYLYAFPMVAHYRSESSGNLLNTHLEKKSSNLLCLEMDKKKMSSTISFFPLVTFADGVQETQLGC